MTWSDYHEEFRRQKYLLFSNENKINDKRPLLKKTYSFKETSSVPRVVETCTNSDALACERIDVLKSIGLVQFTVICKKMELIILSFR